MTDLEVFNDYLKMTNSIVGIANISSKEIVVKDGDSKKVVPFDELATIIANKYDLVPNFKRKLGRFLNGLDPKNELFELPMEYSGNDGTLKNILFLGKKESDNEILLIIFETRTDNSGQLDELTKANSKSYIVKKVNSAIASHQEFVLMIVDIDYFKQFNDTYGHMFGDIILIELVAECQKLLGDKGSIARIGGDEFLIFVNVEDDYDIVHALCFDIKQSLQKISAAALKGVVITVTIGSAQFPSDGDSFELLFRKCDKALYRGKKKGRDCFVMYSLEKCGPVTLEDEFEVETKEVEGLNAKNNLFSVLTGVNQFLNNDNAIDDGIESAINLIGNYFYIDRISLARIDPRSKKILKKDVWHNKVVRTKYEPRCSEADMPIWAEAMGEKMFIRTDDSRTEPENWPLKEAFNDDHTIASLSFELVINDMSFGLLRFDMTTGKRHWQPEDYQVFLLISKLFATYIQREYRKEISYKNLYFNKKYNCNNTTKFYTDATEYLFSNSSIEYSIMDFCLVDFVKLDSIIGKKKSKDVILFMVNKLESENDIIYGFKNEGAFVVLFKHKDKNKIEQLFNEINDGLKHIDDLGNSPLLSIIAGVSFGNNEIERLSSVVDNANIARMENKNHTILYYSDEIKEKVMFKSELLYRLDDAIKNNEFLLYLQPKVSTITGEVVGAEALSRWNYKKERLLPPDLFIPVLEQNGVIERLDFDVFERVCKFQRKIIDLGFKPIPISVNVSRYVVNFMEYIKKIDCIRNKYNILSNLIEIEITEGMYYENTDDISKFISELHSNGYKVSMDDFGSGYSNFTSLANLNFDTIKLDKSFCSDLMNEKAKTMLLKITELVKALNMETLCEGVETFDNVEYLKNIGCDIIQGYYYDKPLPSEEFLSKYFK